MQSISTFEDPNVAIWRLDNFADLYKQLIVGDHIASELFAFQHSEFGEINFCLELESKSTDNPSCVDLYIRIIKSPCEFSIFMECDSWMETIDKKCSKTRKFSDVDLFFDEDSTFNNWNFLSPEQIAEFSQSTTVFVCCRLPCPVKSISSLSTKNTLYRWTITDFESLFNAAQLDTWWSSDYFQVAEFKGVKFAIYFYPKGNIGKYENKCAIFLDVNDRAGYSKIPIHCAFWIENEKSRLWKLELTHVYSTIGDYGFSAYAEQEELQKFAKNGPFDICCDVRAIIDPVPLSDISFQSELASMFDDPYFSDTEIRVDNRVFKVNKAIISCKSPVFRAMFNKETKEQKSGVVTIEGFEASMVEKMLIYIYKNEVTNLKECDAKLLPIADCYQVNSLVKKCTESILDNLTVDSLLPTLELAFEHEHIKQFKDGVFTFAHQNRKEMQKLPEYTIVLKKVPEIAIELLAIAYAHIS